MTEFRCVIGTCQISHIHNHIHLSLLRKASGWRHWQSRTIPGKPWGMLKHMSVCYPLSSVLQLITLCHSSLLVKGKYYSVQPPDLSETWGIMGRFLRPSFVCGVSEFKEALYLIEDRSVLMELLTVTQHASLQRLCSAAVCWGSMWPQTSDLKCST